MRLLHCQHYTLHEFMGEPPPYAILSHTWEGEEVTLQEIQNPTSAVFEKRGYTKIRKCCELAWNDGFAYAWIDTCCIDKTSSAELSEAINSMYKWYQQSDVCYVYLSDYEWSVKDEELHPSFKDCRWFTRGWTLQELIAPNNVLFFNKDWKELGTKLNLCEALHRITEIQVALLEGLPTSSYSVAQRMCWAAKRTTTRSEDMAYSLLGIFEIHMPLLYGEGDKAFIRLQEAIMSKYSDLPMFAWGLSTSVTSNDLLARSPAQFGGCSRVVRQVLQYRPPSVMKVANDGIYLELPILRLASTNELCALLGSRLGPGGRTIALRLDSTWDSQSYTIAIPHRSKGSKLLLVKLSEIASYVYRSLFIPQANLMSQMKMQHGYNTIIVELTALNLLKVRCIYGGTLYDGRSTVFFNEFPTLSVDGYLETSGLVLCDDFRNYVTLFLLYNPSDEDGESNLKLIFKEGLQPRQQNEQALRKKLDSKLVGGFRTEGLFWQHARGSWALTVSQRRRIVAGLKAVVITLSDKSLDKGSSGSLPDVVGKATDQDSKG